MSRFHNRNFELLEPYDAKVSRTVLRGEGSSNAPDLLDVIIDNSRSVEDTRRQVREALKHVPGFQFPKGMEEV